MTGWSNQPVLTSLVIIESVSESGLFVYSGTPGAGDLVASIAAGLGPQADPFGNTVIPVIASYINNSPTPGGTLVASLNDGTLLMELLPGGAFSSANAGTVALFPAPNGQRIQIFSGKVNPGDIVGILNIGDSGVLGLDVPELDFNGMATFHGSASGGQMLTVQNTHSAPGNSNVELIGQAAADNMLGIMVTGDAFNRIKVTTDRLLAGSGAAAQDTQLYRSGVSQWSADTITADIGGSSEVWHSLGTLAGATVNKGRYRLLPDGEVKVEIDVTFGAGTAVPITFSNTLPASYQPPGSVDVRSPASQTNGAGGVARFFVGSAGGGNAGQVQIAALANVIGTYSAYFSYSVL